VRDAAGWVEGGEQVSGVGGPVAAGLGDGDEAGAEGERGMAGEVGEGEHLVAERGDEEEVGWVGAGGEDAGHLEGDFAAEAVGLDVVDGGEVAGLAEGVGPGIGLLAGELVEAAGEGEVFEGGGGLGEEDELERVVGPVGEGDFDGDHAELTDGVEGGAVNVGGGGFVHPLGEVAYAEGFASIADGGGGVEVEVGGDARGVAGVGAGDGVKDEKGVFDGAGHGAELVERPAEGHGAGAGDAAKGGAEAGDAAAHGGTDDGAAGFGADGEADQPCGGGGSRTRRGTRRAFDGEPGVHGLAAEPDVVEGEGAEGELGDEDGAGLVEAGGDGGVGGGDAVAIGFGAPGGGDPGGVEEVFGTPGDAVEGAAVVAGGYFLVGLPGLGQGVVGGEGDDAAELGVEVLETGEVDIGEALGGEGAVLDPAGEGGDGGVGDVGFVGGERWGWDGGTDEVVDGGELGRSGGADGIANGVGGEDGLKGDLAGADAALVEGGHGRAPVAGDLFEVGVGWGDLEELVGFGEGGGCDLGAGGGRGAEGGGHAGGGGWVGGGAGVWSGGGLGGGMAAGGGSGEGEGGGFEETAAGWSWCRGCGLGGVGSHA